MQYIVYTVNPLYNIVNLWHTDGQYAVRSALKLNKNSSKRAFE